METLKNLFGKNLRQYGIMLALVLIVIVFAIWTQGRLLMPNNMQALIQQNAYVIILALGMLLVIIAGHIDLSVGSVVGFVGACVGAFMYYWHWAWPVAVLAGIVIGVCVGIWHGFWVAYVRIPAFVVTLAGMLIFRGLATIIAARTLAPFPQGFNNIAGGAVPTFAGFMPNPLSGLFPTASPFGVSLDLVTLLVGILGVGALIFTSIRSRNSQLAHGLAVEDRTIMIVRLAVISLAILFVTVLLSMNTAGSSGKGGAPIVLLIVGVLILVYAFVSSRTVFGRHVYAIGGNRAAALLSGVNNVKVDFWIFVNMGFLAAVAAIVTTSRAGAAAAAAGQGYELDAIASCFIGGTAVTGGIGRVSGAVIGALVIGVLNMGMSILGWNPNLQSVIKGLVLLLAVTLDLVSKRRSSVA